MRTMMIQPSSMTDSLLQTLDLRDLLGSQRRQPAPRPASATERRRTAIAQAEMQDKMKELQTSRLTARLKRIEGPPRGIEAPPTARRYTGIEF